MAQLEKFWEPMLCRLETKPFDDRRFIFERKLDGVRFIAVKRGGRVWLWTRNQKDRAKQFPEIISDLKELSGDFVIDGEAVVYNRKGMTLFQLIQPRIQQTNDSAIKKLVKSYPAIYEVFDLLILNGKDCRSAELLQRKLMLQKPMCKNLKYVKTLAYVENSGKKLFAKAKKSNWEGIIAKRKDSKYLSGKRGHGWIKIKTINEQEFVIGGYTAGYGKAKSNFGALLLGYYRGKDLIFAGEVGTGFTDVERKELKKRLVSLRTSKSSFKTIPKIKEVTWVKPTLVGQFKFAEWTRDNILRVPVYLGLRDDKSPKLVVKE